MNTKLRVAIVLSIFFVLILISLLTKPIDDEVIVSHISVGYLENNEIVLTDVLPQRLSGYFVCGHLRSVNPQWLQIHIYDVAGNRLGGNDSRLKIKPGNFCEEIILSSYLAPGTYNYEIIYAHNALFKGHFSVKE